MKYLGIAQKITIKNIFTNEIISGVITSIKKTQDFTRMVCIESKEFSIVLSEHNINLNYEFINN